MCEWGLDSPWIWGDEYSQEWRMSGDHTATWDSTKEIIVSSGLIPANYSGRPYGWNGMDMLETGCAEQCAHANGKQANMTATEYKTEFSMWSISASPLIITTRIMNCTNTTGVVTCNGWLSDLQKEIMLNTEVIAINQDVTPQGRPIVEGDFSVWARHLSDGSIAVALLNLNDQPADLLVEFLNLGWPAGQSASVRDLWAHADLGTFKDQYPNTPITVAPHETHLIRLTPA
jgi:alpha-galactosidase